MARTGFAGQSEVDAAKARPIQLADSAYYQPPQALYVEDTRGTLNDLWEVIRAAQSKSLREISEAVKDLAHRARNKRMKPEEFQGGTFTVSNLGSYGIDSFSAIINPPQGFILAIGGISKRAVVDDCDQISVGQRMSITMSCDHRVIDGALGAEYLKELRRLLENPTLLLI